MDEDEDEKTIIITPPPRTRMMTRMREGEANGE